MRYQVYVAVAGVLATAFMAGGAYAQDTHPLPDTMTDTAPTPASDRDSLGAVIMMDQPVLAQRQQMLQAQERTAVDTRTLGAGPARVIRETFEQQRAREATQSQGGTPK
ncbi:hypothetical protein [Ramlibacter sp.]|uniref:hypothetical protein n=1 Tax=Ramlibacter sp. TaxID=1917967 RepID=UPI002606A8D0|nr:hypothetical protein [Ramlibacter sp.]MDB5956283.1 hypothetical protein [Ramlibacter sp.]